MNLVREPDAVNPPVRFDEREVETEHGMRLLRHKRGNPETEYAEAYPTAPPLDSTRIPRSSLVRKPQRPPRLQLAQSTRSPHCRTANQHLSAGTCSLRR